jgi:hypothetical protein
MAPVPQALSRMRAAAEEEEAGRGGKMLGVVRMWVAMARVARPIRRSYVLAEVLKEESRLDGPGGVVVVVVVEDAGSLWIDGWNLMERGWFAWFCEDEFGKKGREREREGGGWKAS